MLSAAALDDNQTDFDVPFSFFLELQCGEGLNMSPFRLPSENHHDSHDSDEAICTLDHKSYSFGLATPSSFVN